MNTVAPLQNSAVKSPPVSKSPYAGLLLQRKCACGGSASSSLSGECGECNKKRLQKKLSIGASNDPLEQEADRIADQVLAAPANTPISGTPLRIQRFTAQSMGQADIAPASVDRVLSGSGRPLEPALRQDMEQRFGHDFSRVRVHSGGAAEKSARDMDASAYTVGRDIVFGVGSYAPRSAAGRRLLAHELTHTLQQEGCGRRVQRALAGGCAEPGDTWPEAMEESSLAGVNAHNQIQEKFFPQLDIEAELPRGSKERQGKGCPEKNRKSGKLDLWRSTGGHTVQIGEIKSVNSKAKGLEEVQHYLLRYRQMIERLTGGGCYETVPDQKDKQFVSMWLHRNLEKDELPEAVALNSVVPATKTLVGVYRGNLKKDLYCQRVQGGTVVYWCAKKGSSQQEDESKRKADAKSRDVPASKQDGNNKKRPKAEADDINWWLLGGGGALVTTAALAPKLLKPKVPTIKPPVVPTAPSMKAPVTATPKGGGVRPITSARSYRPPGAPKAGGGAGRVAGGIGIAAGFAFALWELHSLMGSYGDAKDRIEAMRAYQDQFWKEWEEHEAQRKAAAKNAPSPDVVTAPPPPLKRQPDPEPPKPVEKKVKIRLYSIDRAMKIRVQEVEVSSSTLDAFYYPVRFWSLTSPGKTALDFDANRADCSKINSGVGAISGWKEFDGYATTYDTGRLKGVLSAQLDIIRLRCVASNKIPKAAQLNTDEVSATILLSDTPVDVTATCRRTGGGVWACERTGDFADLKQETDDPDSNEKYKFELYLTLDRVRNGESQHHARTVVAWLGNPDHPAPEPTIRTEGSIPSDVTNWKQYPAGSALAYLLENYGRWGA
ncbi:MAG: protein of unknown function (DUF4157) [Candidatus Nitrotoga sp. LAW]|nr:MAG: protein of unknown function (DUF4157) [Candidatus Nitrotoga sp. LAW]